MLIEIVDHGLDLPIGTRQRLWLEPGETLPLPGRMLLQLWADQDQDGWEVKMELFARNFNLLDSGEGGNAFVRYRWGGAEEILVIARAIEWQACGRPNRVMVEITRSDVTCHSLLGA